MTATTLAYSRLPRAAIPILGNHNFAFLLAVHSANVPTVMTITDTEREIFRRMAPADKLHLVSQLHMQARVWKKAALRAQHRDWTDDQVDKRVREIFLYGTG